MVKFYLPLAGNEDRRQVRGDARIRVVDCADAAHASPGEANEQMGERHGRRQRAVDRSPALLQVDAPESASCAASSAVSRCPRPGSKEEMLGRPYSFVNAPDSAPTSSISSPCRAARSHRSLRRCHPARRYGFSALRTDFSR
jgi:hypothetical protein